MILRHNRISIDLDTKNQFQLLKAYFNLKRLTTQTEVRETVHGFHVIGRMDNRTGEQNIHVRMMLNDCEGRLELDEKRLDAGLDDCIDTLFRYKRIVDRFGKDIIGREEPYDIMSEQFWGFRIG
jgi:hypothetical protein